jgi:glycosyltransferase involved in cell wall biosynthesis
MDVLIYTQVRSIGGSLRLLSNLAKQLVKHGHRLSFVVASDREKEIFKAAAGDFGAEYVVTRNPSELRQSEPDVMIYHLPYSLDESLAVRSKRKIAVILEIPGERSIPITADNCERFDEVIYLQEEQVTHIPQSARDKRFHRLTVINDVDFHPGFRRTGCVGAIGGRRKHTVSTITKVLKHSPEVQELKIYGNFKGAYPVLDRAVRFLPFSHRVRIMGVEYNIENMYGAFDCLLHTPRNSMGTSMVVNNALACGKLVVLSDVPAHRAHFGECEGVFFVNDIGCSLDPLLQGYDVAAFTKISTDYASRYNRQAVLSEWEAVIANCTAHGGSS